MNGSNYNNIEFKLDVSKIIMKSELLLMEMKTEGFVILSIDLACLVFLRNCLQMYQFYSV